MRRSELRRVAAEDAGDAGQPERLDIGADQRACLGAVVDEQREGRAARDRLQPERAGAGKQVEHARARDRIAIGMDQDIEQRLAQAVGGRPDRLRFRAASVRPRSRPPTMRISGLSPIAAPLAGAGARRSPCGAGLIALFERCARARRGVGRWHLLLRRWRRLRSHPASLRSAGAIPLRRSAALAREGRPASFGSGCDRSPARRNPRPPRWRSARRAARADAASAPRRLRRRQLAELERPERHADQPRDLQPEMAQHVAHLAVLALADRERDPHVEALLAVERRLDRPVVDAVDGDAVAQRIELQPASPAMRAHAVAPQPRRSPAARARAQARRRWSAAAAPR